MKRCNTGGALPGFELTQNTMSSTSCSRKWS